MIEEKIKLRITEYIARVLYNDCFAFDFIRDKEKANINGFVNKLIPNLVKLRKKRRDVIHDTILEAVEFFTDIKRRERLLGYMDTIFDKVYFSDEQHEGFSEEIWIRPNIENIIVFDEIYESELEICQMEISTYLRSLLNEYAKLPQHQRELVVFTEEMDLIKQSIETDRVLNLSYEQQRYKLVAINYYSEFLYDQSNYIIGYDTKSNKLKSLKLYKIKDMYILAKQQHLTDDIYKTFNSIAENFEFANSDTFDIMSEEV